MNNNDKRTIVYHIVKDVQDPCSSISLSDGVLYLHKKFFKMYFHMVVLHLFQNTNDEILHIMISYSCSFYNNLFSLDQTQTCLDVSFLTNFRCDVF